MPSPTTREVCGPRFTRWQQRATRRSSTSHPRGVQKTVRNTEGSGFQSHHMPGILCDSVSSCIPHAFNFIMQFMTQNHLLQDNGCSTPLFQDRTAHSAAATVDNEGRKEQDRGGGNRPLGHGPEVRQMEREGKSKGRILGAGLTRTASLDVRERSE